MITLLTWGLALGAVAGSVAWVWRAWVRPVQDVRAAIAAVNAQESSVPIIRSARPIFREISANLGLVSERLREQRRQLADEVFSLRAILSSMVEGILIVDQGLRIRLANDALFSMFDLTQSPINRTVIEVFHEHGLLTGVERAIGECRPLILEFQVAARPDSGKAIRYFRVNVAPLLPSGGSNPVGALVVFNDVTEIRTLEAVRREFVANVSHEFRTPLAIINGYVETLLDGALDDRAMTERSLAVMHKHAARLNFLIDDLLTISRMENRAVEMKLETVSLRNILVRAIDQHEARIREQNVTLDYQFEPDSEIADVDPTRIEQVFVNLLANALQYGARADGEIRVTARRRGREVELNFADDGPGIPYEDQPHIFERFYRVHKDRSRDAGGTGLGLSIVKNVAMAHGGHVSVRSTPGAGSNFRVTLPVKAPPRN